MPQNFYTEIDLSKIQTHKIRFDWEGKEKIFRDLLYKSISEVGIKDPIHLWYDSPLKKNDFLTRAGNSRLAVASHLGINKIKCIITNFSPDTNKFKGRLLETESEIKEVFHVPESVHVVWHKGWLSVANTSGGENFVKTWSKKTGYFNKSH